MPTQLRRGGCTQKVLATIHIPSRLGMPEVACAAIYSAAPILTGTAKGSYTGSRRRKMIPRLWRTLEDVDKSTHATRYFVGPAVVINVGINLEY